MAERGVVLVLVEQGEVKRRRRRRRRRRQQRQLRRWLVGVVQQVGLGAGVGAEKQTAAGECVGVVVVGVEALRRVQIRLRGRHRRLQGRSEK